MGDLGRSAAGWNVHDQAEGRRRQSGSGGGGGGEQQVCLGCSQAPDTGFLVRPFVKRSLVVQPSRLPRGLRVQKAAAGFTCALGSAVRRAMSL